MRDTNEELTRIKSDRDYFKLKFEEMLKSNKDKEELINQVKDNIQDMRGQRESLNGENSSLKTRVEQMQVSLKVDDEQIKA
jgi:hypothetical protein